MRNKKDKIKAVFENPERIDPASEDAPAPPYSTSSAQTPPLPDGPTNPIELSAMEPLNDYGNGQRFIHHFGDHSLFVSRVSWYCWTGLYWEKDEDTLRTRGVAHKISNLIMKEIPFIRLEDWQAETVEEKPDLLAEADAINIIPRAKRTPTQIADLRRIVDRLALIENLEKKVNSDISARKAFSRKAGDSGPLGNMLLESSVKLNTAFEALDADPLVVNTLSGPLKFSVEDDPHEAQWVKPGDPIPIPKVATVKLLQPDPKQLLSKYVPFEYDPKAKRARFDKFLNRIQPDPKMRGFLQRFLGYAMTGLTGEQKMVFFHGGGSNGKSVLVDIVAQVLGIYCATARIETLTGTSRRGGGDATPDLVPLMGARLVRASEPEDGEQLKEGTIKEMTGGEPMLVRGLLKDFLEVRPIFKLLISGNHKPVVRGTDEGIWRRLLLVPFSVHIPEGERDRLLTETIIREEGPGVLNWLVEGLLDYLINGLQEPDEVLSATKDFREQSDPTHSFLLACCCVDGDEKTFTPSKTLLEAFNYWRIESAENVWTGATVAKRIKEKSDSWKDPKTGAVFTWSKSSVAGYRGIRLNDTFKARMEDNPHIMPAGRGGGRYRAD